MPLLYSKIILFLCQFVSLYKPLHNLSAYKGKVQEKSVQFLYNILPEIFFNREGYKKSYFFKSFLQRKLNNQDLTNVPRMLPVL
jgi:hypothetical protein